MGKKRIIFGIIGIVLIFVAAASMRILGAHWFSQSSSSDHGVPCLMAKHMAEGAPIPVFHYGQPFMGSLEPICSSIFVRIFGPTGIAYNLGPAALSIIFLLLLCAMARRNGGPKAVAAALIFCVIGPPHFFQFSCWCYGGYAAILCLNAAVMLAAELVLSAEEKKAKHLPLMYAEFGLVAGIGWWTSQLLAAVFAAVALLFILVRRQKLFAWRITAFFPGFAIGSAPFWIWNGTHQWETFTLFSSQMGSQTFLEGLHNYFTVLLPGYLACQNNNFFAVVLTVLFLLFMWSTFSEKAWWKFESPTRIRILSLLLFLTLPLLFANSPYGAERYLTPLMMAFAIMAATATCWLLKHLPYGLGWVPLLIVAGFHATHLPVYPQWHAGDMQQLASAKKLAACMKQNNIDCAYVPYLARSACHGFNYLLDEELIFCAPEAEHIPQYGMDAETTDHIAILNNHEHIDEFLVQSGGTRKQQQFDSIMLNYSFTPPTTRLQPIKTVQISSFNDERGNKLTAELNDLFTRSHFKSQPEERAQSVYVTLHHSTDLEAIRIYSHHDRYPMEVDLFRKENDTWVPVMQGAPFTRLFWSGKRLYCSPHAFRWELRIPEGSSDQWRLAFHPWGAHVFEIDELQLFVIAPESATEPEIENLVTLLKEKKISKLYSDRGLANQLHAACNEITYFRDPEIFGANQTLPSDIAPVSGTAILLPTTELSMCTAMLQQRGIPFYTTATGPLTLITFSSINNWEHGLTWDGCNLLSHSERIWGATLLKRARQALAGDNRQQAAALAENALKHYPDYAPAAAFLTENKLQPENNHLSALATSWTPDTETNIHFGNGIELKGISLSEPDANGNRQLKYYWYCPDDLVPSDLAAFVHIKNAKGKNITQDDHVLLDGIDVSDHPVPHCDVEDRSINLPDQDFSIWLGLYHRNPPHHRLKTKTTLPKKRNAVQILSKQ